MGMRESLTNILILKSQRAVEKLKSPEKYLIQGLQNTKLWYNRNIENKRSKQRGC